MAGFEANKVVYTSDVLKFTIERVEGLPAQWRRKRCICEVAYDEVVQSSDKRGVDKQGSIECAALNVCKASCKDCVG